MHFLSEQIAKLSSEASGSTIKGIVKEDLFDMQIPLPPLATQKRIAEILDAADALRRKDQELLKKYDELAQAIFIDMFGDPVKNEKGWDVKKLDAVCSKITDGEHGTVKRLANGKPYLMARNIRDGFIDFAETDFISEGDHKRIFKRCNPEKDDLFLVCVGATIGRVCLMNSNDEYSLARSVALIKPIKKSLNSKFLYSIFKSDFIQLQIKAANNSSAQAGLYTGKIKDLNIFIPPIELQNEFEIRINILLEQSKCIDVNKSDAIFKSLIQKAFKGELVA
jgi:type I restriction enzyme S subunit